MKRYYLAKHFWITLSCLAMAGLDVLIASWNYIFYGEMEWVLPWIFFAIFLVVVACIFIRLGQWLYPFEAKPFEETAEYVHAKYGVNYALKQEIERKQAFVNRLRSDQKKVIKVILLGGLLGFLGGVMFVIAIPSVRLEIRAVLSAYVSLAYTSLAFGSALLVLGVRLVVKGTVNSDLEFAYRIAEKYGIDTNEVKIRQQQILIGVLQERLEQEKKEDRKRREEELAREKEMMESIMVTIPDNVDIRG